MNFFRRVVLTVTVLLLPSAASAATNYVLNGDFEDSTPVDTTTYPTSVGGIGQIGPIVTLPSWLTTCLKDCTDGGVGSGGFAFVVNANADNRTRGAAYPNQGGGFPSKNSPTANSNIFVWGPDYDAQGVGTASGTNGPIANGFTGSSNGGKFVGIDGDYGQAKIKQSVSGLTIGNAYKLSFEYAGAQFSDQTGATNQKWTVRYNNGTTQEVSWQVSSTGFKSWATQEYDFTATSTSFDLEFEAYGRGVIGDATGLPPFLLLDNVQILDPSTPPPPVPPVPPTPGGSAVPGPLPIIGAGMSLAWSRRLRKRLMVNS